MPKQSVRHSVIVKHVTNEEVGHHVNMLGVKNQRKTRSSCGGIAADFFNNEIPVISKKKASKSVETNEKDTENDVLERVNSMTPVVWIENSEQYAGGSVYAFKTPKRSKQMSKLAAESAMKVRSVKKSSSKENSDPDLNKITEKVTKTSKGSSEEGIDNKNLKSKTPAKKSGAIPKTPAKLTAQSPMTTKSDGDASNIDSAKNTPSRSSNRIKKYLVQEMQAQQQEDDSESSDESGSEEEEEAEKDSVAVGGEPSRISQSSKRIDLPSETELYFEAHKGGVKLGTSTSDRTLSKLKLPQMNLERMQTILEELHTDKTSSQSMNDAAKIEKARRDLVKENKRYFRKWMFYICSGYNILLYGLGSKRKLIHEFCDKMLTGFDKIVVNGYFPSLIVKSLVTSICEIAGETIVAVSNQQQVQLDAICQNYSENETGDHLFIIIHNIDGVTLRNSKAQNILSQLAACKRIHVIATIDHINASLIWDQPKLSRYNWLWYDVTTYEPYKDETSFEDSLLLLTSGSGIGGSLALSGLVHVARSLTPNARGIFKLIAEFQIEESKNNSLNYIGLSFSDLYQKCREKFLVNSELTLRTQLTEFLDHKLIQIRKGIDGGECLSIPLDNSTLQEYLDQAQ